MKEKIDIIVSTCNRFHFLRKIINAFWDRLTNPHLARLIIIDDASEDDTVECVEKLKEIGTVDVFVSRDFKHLCEMYNEGFKYVKTEYFIVTQDDMVIPKLKPDAVEQLVALMEKHPEQAGIACRMQRIPNMKWVDGDLTPARKNLSTCFRIQKQSDIEKVGGFGNRHWEERAFVERMRSLGKEVSWANNLWCNHIGFVPGRGYNVKPKKWGVGILSRTAPNRETDSPYPEIDPITNVPIKQI